MMPRIVFLLCALTSGVCALLFIRQYRRTHTRLLLWSSVGFGGLALNNLLLVLDLIVLPTVDLLYWRSIVSCLSIMVLLGGLIWDNPA